MEKLNRSLNDIIKEQRSGPIRRPNTARRAINRSGPVQLKGRGAFREFANEKTQSGQKSSILDRLGNRSDEKVSGTKVEVSNLKYDILEDDLNVLFGTIGEVKSCQIQYDRSGRSLGNATVMFARRSDAIKAVQELNQRTIDSVPMQVKLAGQNGKENPFNPTHRDDDGDDDDDDDEDEGPKNVREGLFGTEFDKFEGRGRNRRDRGRRNFGKKRQRRFPNSNPSKPSFNGEKRRGGNKQGNRQENNSDVKMTCDELDAELDEYMAKRV